MTVGRGLDNRPNPFAVAFDLFDAEVGGDGVDHHQTTTAFGIEANGRRAMLA